jgi:tRNA U34 5-carboxymethylaminomethyl modifying enzyme MnmG/GidA
MEKYLKKSYFLSEQFFFKFVPKYFVKLPVKGLSHEVNFQFCCLFQIAAASRIPGITPACIVVLLRYVKNLNQDSKSNQTASSIDIPVAS